MPNRRDFFKSVGGATAGAYVIGHGQARRGAGARGAPAGLDRGTPRSGRRRACPHGHSAGRCRQRHAVRETGAEAIPAWTSALSAMDKQGLDVQALSINGFW